jgi:hypothetical protein
MYMQGLTIVGRAERDCEAIVGAEVVIIPVGDGRGRTVRVAAAGVIAGGRHVAETV